MLTVLTVELPIRKATVRFSAPQTCLPARTPLRCTRTLTSVLPGQYFSGRQCTSRSEIQLHEPTTSREVSTVRPACTAARSLTGLLSRTMIGMPTPTV